MHQLPSLDYPLNALEPMLSAETLEFHHGKHHRKYVDKLNELAAGTRFADMALEDVVRRATGDLFDQASQHYNHALYWKCLTPRQGSAPSSLSEALAASWGSLEAFREAFEADAKKLFGSGWCWLVRRQDGSLAIRQTGNAGCPLTEGHVPLLCCDVWEHAYYIDYRNARGKYLKAFWKLVNWEYVGERLKHAQREGRQVAEEVATAR